MLKLMFMWFSGWFGLSVFNLVMSGYGWEMLVFNLTGMLVVLFFLHREVKVNGYGKEM
jgi:hypothetical protein